MKLHYFRSRHGNFGDDLNAWLWPELMPGVWDEGEDGTTFVGVGTILNKLVPDSRRKIVLGSGVGYAPLPEGLHDGSWEILAVRGPLSARAANLPRDKAITDGAILLSAIPGLVKPIHERTGGVVFVPHVSSAASGGWQAICNEIGVTYLDPRRHFHEVFAEIANARLVLADAMHAAIVADTFRVPWVPLVSSREISSFKWMDWTLSMDVPYRPTRLPASSLPEAMREWMVPLMGRSYLNQRVLATDPAPTASLAEDLLLQLEDTSRREENPAWQWINRIAQRGWNSVGSPASARAARGALRSADARCRDSAARALEKAVQTTSYLSADPTYERKRSQMLDCVEQVRGVHAKPVPA